ncbi:MAG: hypothetical protein IKQ91_08240 [Oscillospiraceae bacterium]|nr:hypothetical protein [Oscillospiraceae bacterium]
MLFTSAKASKLLRKLNEELQKLEIREDNSKTFLASLEEDPESVRPDYDYSAMLVQMTELEQRIRKLKHALNVFNSTTVIPEFGITIDEMLVYMPQLTHRCSRLSAMQNVMPKARAEAGYGHVSTIIDYRYVNYDIEQVTKDHEALSDTLARAQMALDLVNSTVQFDIDI